MSIPQFEAFPEEIISDYNVLYHGTSSVAEDLIDQEGLRPLKDPNIEEVFHGLKEIYELVLGGHVDREGSGFVQLPYFWAELQKHGMRPISLSVDHERCFRYAGKECCGGEIAESIALVRPYLLSLINDPQARANRQASIDRKIKSYPPNMHPSYYDRKVLDVAELERRVAAIEPTMQRLLALRDQYRHGVIYAIRLNASEWREKLHGEMGGGLYALENIPVSAIMGKVIVHEVLTESLGDEKTTERLERIAYWNS